MGSQAQAAFVVSGAKWGPSQTFGTTGGVVTYSFMGAGLDMSAEGAGLSVDLATFMPVGYKAAIVAAFNAWSAVADITFVEVADSNTAFNAPGSSGDIRIGGHVFDGPGGVLAHGYFPQVGAPSFAGDIHFDAADTWKIGFGGGGFDIFQVAAHEIGHAIGLSHDTLGGSLMSPFYSEAFLGLQANDIAGAQFIYGAARPSAVPEPASMAVWSLAAIGVVVSRRKQRSTKAIAC
ncbi:MAG: matrixin family metalloprotease [Planctomyces sp.]|nr:matrixin family metalloprotease [Planctomyces sp.]